jgi:hypothetical protein
VILRSHFFTIKNGVIFAAAVIGIHQLLAAYTRLFDDIPTKSEVKRAKKHARELTPY